MTDEFGEAVLYAVGKRFGDDKDSRIGFEEWNLLDMDDFSRVMESLVKKSLRAGFKLAEEEYKCHAWFACEYADGAEMPPGTIAVELPLGPTEDSGPQWQFSLYEMVKRMIDYYQNREDGTVEKREAFEQVRDEMRELADIIDTVLKGEVYVEK